MPPFACVFCGRWIKKGSSHLPTCPLELNQDVLRERRAAADKWPEQWADPEQRMKIEQEFGPLGDYHFDFKETKKGLIKRAKWEASNSFLLYPRNEDLLDPVNTFLHHPPWTWTEEQYVLRLRLHTARDRQRSQRKRSEKDGQATSASEPIGHYQRMQGAFGYADEQQATDPGRGTISGSVDNAGQTHHQHVRGDNPYDGYSNPQQYFQYAYNQRAEVVPNAGSYLHSYPAAPPSSTTAQSHGGYGYEASTASNYTQNIGSYAQEAQGWASAQAYPQHQAPGHAQPDASAQQWKSPQSHSGNGGQLSSQVPYYLDQQLYSDEDIRNYTEAENAQSHAQNYGPIIGFQEPSPHGSLLDEHYNIIRRRFEDQS